MVIARLQPTAKKWLWTLDLREIRLHGWYQVILWFTLDDIVKGVSLRAWLLAHAYSLVLPKYSSRKHTIKRFYCTDIGF